MKTARVTAAEARPRCLDLFCGAGGCAVGYFRAGFDVFGVDNDPKPLRHYPFLHVCADALEYCREHGHEYDFIHASPPCQAYSRCRTMHTCRDKKYPDLISETRATLMDIGKVYVIENVKGAPLISPMRLTGLMFGLCLFRERWFESPLLLLAPEIPKPNGNIIGRNGFVCMAGHGDSGRGRIPADHRTLASWQVASGIDWMTMAEMAQAIPPAYCEFIGKQILEYLNET